MGIVQECSKSETVSRFISHDEESLYIEVPFTVPAGTEQIKVKMAGIDPLSYIKKFPNRIPILHLKDMTNDERKYFAEVGTGSIDFEPILAWGEQNGVEFYAVEQDFCPGNPLDSLELSLTNLIKMSEKVNA